MFYLATEQRHAAAGKPRRLPCRICQREKNFARIRPRAAYVDAVKVAAGCTDCGIRNDAHPEIFDFDHLPGVTKAGSVAAFLTKGTLDDLKAEIAKCEVVCANCHRIRTRARGSLIFGRKG
jgi:hypothetical protein